MAAKINFGLSNGRRTARYIFLIFNILLMICSILVITFGSIMVLKIGDFSSLEKAFTTNSVGVFICILGCVMLVISLLGFCIAFGQNNCTLWMYACVMFVLFSCQLVSIVYVWIKEPQILSSFDDGVQTIWNQRKTNSSDLDALQTNFKCCGLNRLTDYGIPPTYLPTSCCEYLTNGLCEATRAPTRPGCSEASALFWERNINIIKYVGLGVIGIQTASFIYGYYNIYKIRNYLTQIYNRA